MRLRTHPHLAIALAAASTLVGLTARAADSAGSYTVSFSGSTAMQTFTISPDFSAMTPGTTRAINGITYALNPTDPASETFPIAQLAGPLGTTPVPPNPISNSYTGAVYRIEWHAQGSVEGIVEMANDQIGYFGSTPLVAASTRGPTTGNPIYVQRNSQTAVGGLIQGSGYNTYDSADYNLSSGTNVDGGQNRVQIAISDVRAAQGFSITGPASFNRKAGEAGYGKGNPALAPVASNLGLGSAGVRRTLVDQNVLNMESTKVNPQTGANYAANKPWNDAGLNNTVSTRVAATATTFAANPGTGLTDLNKADAQWLQATGRLSNGADFNVVTRDINSGTLNVASQNVGLDPSFAVGENDSGNGTLTGTALSDQLRIGPGLRFSGKTSGGSQLRPTVQASRMAIGHLSLNDVLGSSVNTTANPLRALKFRNSVDNTGAAVQVSIDSISDGSYALFQFQNYVTVKDPTNGDAAIAAYQASNPGTTAAQAWAALTDAQTGLKGDNAGNDARDFRDNIIASATQFPTNASFINPGNGLLAGSLLPTRLMRKTKTGDGEAVTNNPDFNETVYNQVRGANAFRFAAGDSPTVTSGSSSSLYGQGTVNNPDAVTANIAVTGANYLFGDFDGNGVRDFKDIKYAQQASNALNTKTIGLSNDTTVAVGTNWLNGSAVTGDTASSRNVVTVYNALTKGDLVVKGDFNSDGSFDGRDLYAIARGTALADAGKTASALIANPDTGTLTTASGATVSDQYRGGVLYKNAALDYLQANTTAAQKASGSANSTVDPNGANAFNKFDVNRDGRVNRDDAGIVDSFVGRDYRVLADELAAVVATNANAAGTRFVGNPTLDQTTPRKSISLVDAELNDTGTITHLAITGGTSDFKLIRQALGTLLLDGDTDFDGGVSINDFNALATNFGQATGQKWSSGDFDFDGGVSINDFNLLAAGFGQTAPSGAQWAGLLAFAAAHDDLAAFEAVTGVPEPTGLALLAGGSLAALRRRRT